MLYLNILSVLWPSINHTIISKRTKVKSITNMAAEELHEWKSDYSPPLIQCTCIDVIFLFIFNN